jgi:hypothetical protein
MPLPAAPGHASRPGDARVERAPRRRADVEVAEDQPAHRVDRVGERIQAVEEGQPARRPGVPIAAPFRRATDAFLERLETEPVEAIVAVPAWS